MVANTVMDVAVKASKRLQHLAELLYWALCTPIDDIAEIKSERAASLIPRHSCQFHLGQRVPIEALSAEKAHPYVRSVGVLDVGNYAKAEDRSSGRGHFVALRL